MSELRDITRVLLHVSTAITKIRAILWNGKFGVALSMISEKTTSAGQIIFSMRMLILLVFSVRTSISLVFSVRTSISLLVSLRSSIPLLTTPILMS